MVKLDKQSVKPLKWSELNLGLRRIVPKHDGNIYIFIYPKFIKDQIKNIFYIPFNKKIETVIKAYKLVQVDSVEFETTILNLYVRKDPEIGYCIIKNLKNNDEYIYRC